MIRVLVVAVKNISNVVEANEASNWIVDLLNYFKKE